MKFIHQPAPDERLGDFLGRNFRESWTTFRAAIAFAKQSGTKHVITPLSNFSRIHESEIIIGIDHHGTSKEALEDLLNAVGGLGKIIVFHNNLPITFHPKIYLFKSEKFAEVLIGSGNLTEGGLFSNYEAGIKLDLKLRRSTDHDILQSIEKILNDWANPYRGTALPLDFMLLEKLFSAGLILSETQISDNNNATQKAQRSRKANISPFAAHPEPKAPFLSPLSRPTQPSHSTIQSTDSPLFTDIFSADTPQTGFVMTLQRTDVGVGQTTSGTSRRSPEIFIPLRARNAAPSFWGWQNLFTEDPNKPGKFDRQNVRMRIGTEIISVNMMTWPAKHDFRLRSETLRSAGDIGDILRIEKVNPRIGYEYYVEIIPKGTSQHELYKNLCANRVQNSKKTYGYY